MSHGYRGKALIEENGYSLAKSITPLKLALWGQLSKSSFALQYSKSE
ncbi:MAG: hypothetical protein KAH18_00855 [Psychromonas sp.]|nr:hypothetical protein [Psychromonas sp.]